MGVMNKEMFSGCSIALSSVSDVDRLSKDIMTSLLDWRKENVMKSHKTLDRSSVTCWL